MTAMATPGWDSDEQLFEELKAAVAGPGVVADRVLEAAHAAFTWRTVDEELERLTLSYDSLVNGGALVRAPITDASRTLVFESESFMVGVEVGREVLTGQLVPAQVGHITLMTPEGWCGETEGDEAGFFLLARPAPGPIRLHCSTPDARLVTEWVSL